MNQLPIQIGNMVLLKISMVILIAQINFVSKAIAKAMEMILFFMLITNKMPQLQRCV